MDKIDHLTLRTTTALSRLSSLQRRADKTQAMPPLVRDALEELQHRARGAADREREPDGTGERDCGDTAAGGTGTRRLPDVVHVDVDPLRVHRSRRPDPRRESARLAPPERRPAAPGGQAADSVLYGSRSADCRARAASRLPVRAADRRASARAAPARGPGPWHPAARRGSMVLVPGEIRRSRRARRRTSPRPSRRSAARR